MPYEDFPEMSTDTLQSALTGAQARLKRARSVNGRQTAQAHIARIQAELNRRES